ncbi:MAG: HAD family hydrolase [Limnochordia bacterium]
MHIRLQKGVKPLSLLIFDLDGTLIDSYAPLLASFVHTITTLKLPIPPMDELKRTIGFPLEDALAMFMPQALVEEAVGLFRGYYQGIVLQETTLLPGARATLRALAEHATLAVATNKASHMAVDVLEHLGVAQFFSLIVGTHCVAEPKPAADMVEKILKDLDCPREEAVLVGDSIIDVQFSQNSGVDLICVLTGSNTEGELRAAGGENIVASVENILHLCSPWEGEMEKRAN